MSYKDFSIKRVQADFQLKIVEGTGLFSTVPDAQVSEYFSITLQENIPLAVAINTEKARSELIISEVLLELRKQFDRTISFFSGIEFNVDKEKDLNGFCDFIVSLSPEQLFVRSPVIVIVEAKNENIMAGLGQCMAAMVAGKIFNEQEGNPINSIYGAVTSGVAWKFLKLQDDTAFIDLKDYNLEDKSEKVMGIFSAMLNQAI
jgi:hypothetical protein